MEFFEDIVAGQKSRFGSRRVTREEVIEFASRYDPQPFHIDDEAAAATHFKRLCASGWHTCALTMAMFVEEMKARGHQGLGSPGVDELRWLKPVYPGDVLSCELEVLDTRRSRSRPERGIVRHRLTTYNQNGEAVMHFTANGMVAVRGD
ncbi:enoyl-CoA hydratase [Novosphingobium endophyticum]|uniref:Enoyl-CoA hydratase n=1 Tax=Novosphingobium endophyticum TaxID=1955250 RepID=A0A916X544_9SPHN|nr:MaoC family dehydratase [Novosphingobium endophyticum]GGB97737.1 enoyl-CoA hydratase [Novosphingobium endophyticum]